MQEFDYQAVATIDEAVGLLSTRGERARILAGGTDIIVQLREGLREADLVLDVKKIPELSAIEFKAASGLKLGAAVSCHTLYNRPELVRAYPGLIDSSRIIGGWQIQTRASIGGNLCNSSPAADSIPSLLALRATAVIAGPEGTRRVPVAEFCTGPGRNCLARGEFLVTLEFPATPEKSSSAYLRFIPRNEMDIAVVGVGVSVQLDKAGSRIENATIALGAVAPTPVLAEEANRWIKGQPATADTFAQAGELAKQSAKPISDRRGPAEYRMHLVGVLVKRTLAIAVDRARGGVK